MMVTRYIIDREHLAKRLGLDDILKMRVIEDNFLVITSNDDSLLKENRVTTGGFDTMNSRRF